MDLKNLLGKLDLLEGSMSKAEKNPTGPKFTGKWKGTDAGLPGKKLVGDSIEPQESILKDLSKGPTPKTKEQDLAEQFEEFLQALEEENLGVETKRPARKGSRPGREYTSNEKPSKRYKTIKEDAMGDSEEANAVVAEIINLIGDGHTEVSPDVIIAKVSAQLGRPFMLKDLVATNNNSPELQHYISSINPTKIKFSTDILTVKNEDPMKEKQAAQNGVANMAARAASRPRLGESDQGISKSAETKFHKKLDTLVHDTFGKRKDEVEESTGTKLWRAAYSVEDERYGTPYDDKVFDDEGKAQRHVYNIKRAAELAGEEVPVIGYQWFYPEEEETQYPGEEQYQHGTEDDINRLAENAEELNVGDDVIITGPVEHRGETGVIDSFGQDKRFVVVNLYNHGKKSFHSSDVSYNDYAGSDEEEAEMYDRDPEFRDWAARQDVDEEQEYSSDEQQDFLYKVVCDGYDKGNFVNKNDAIFSGQYMIYYGEKEYHDIKVIELKTGNVIWEWTGEKDTEAPPTESPASKISQAQAHYEDVGTGKERCGNCKFFEDPHGCSKVEGRISAAGICDLYAPVATDESQGDPHKILLNKLRDIERKPSVPNAEDDARRAEQAKADYAKYVAKMRKKDPNFVPLYKIDEYGANAPAGTASGQTAAGQTATTPTPQQITAIKGLKNVIPGLSSVSDQQLTTSLKKAETGTTDTTSAKILAPLAGMIDQAIDNPTPQQTAAIKNLAQAAKQSSVVQKKP